MYQELIAVHFLCNKRKQRKHLLPNTLVTGLCITHDITLFIYIMGMVFQNRRSPPTCLWLVCYCNIYLHVEYFLGLENCYKFYGKCKVFLMAVYMIFKYGKRFRFAPSFNYYFYTRNIRDVYKIIKIVFLVSKFQNWKQTLTHSFSFLNSKHAKYKDLEKSHQTK